MALESGSQPKDLNPDWPLNTDPAQLGAAHLRLIKLVLRKFFIGTFVDRAAFLAWYATNTVTFYPGALTIIGDKWWQIDSISAGANTTEGRDFFIVDTTWRARVATKPRILGEVNSQGGQGLAIINSNARRRPQLRYVNILTGTAFDAAQAAAAFPAGTPVANDVCVQLVPGSPSYSFIKFYTGSGWSDVGVEVYNSMVAFGLVGAQLLVSESVDTVRVRTMRMEKVGLTNMIVEDPDGFGPDDLIYWYGPKAGLISTNGEIAYGSLVKANALRWIGLDGLASSEAPPSGAVTPLANVGTLGTAYEFHDVGYLGYGGSNTAYANIALVLSTNGNFAVVGNSELLSGTPIDGPYVDNTGVGAGTGLECRFEATGDTIYKLPDTTFDTWQALTSTRSAGVYSSRGETIGMTSRAISLTVRIRKVGDAGSEVSKTLTLTAKAVLSDGAP